MVSQLQSVVFDDRLWFFHATGLEVVVEADGSYPKHDPTVSM
jgi:hypothetical protein